MRFLISLVLALLAHVIAGWSWSILGGVLYGILLKDRSGISAYLIHGLAGAMCVGVSWGILITYNFFIAPEGTASMLDVMGGIMGNLPGVLIVVLTLFIGSLLGLLGAIIGVQVKKTI